MAGITLSATYIQDTLSPLQRAVNSIGAGSVLNGKFAVSFLYRLAVRLDRRCIFNFSDYNGSTYN